MDYPKFLILTKQNRNGTMGTRHAQMASRFWAARLVPQCKGETLQIGCRNSGH